MGDPYCTTDGCAWQGKLSAQRTNAIGCGLCGQPITVREDAPQAVRRDQEALHQVDMAGEAMDEYGVLATEQETGEEDTGDIEEDEGEYE